MVYDTVKRVTCVKDSDDVVGVNRNVESKFEGL